MARNRGLSGVGIGSGFDALVGLEGFMRGWDFGQSINREKEDKADREQARTDKMTERGRATERFEREKAGWAQQDEDRQYTLATREPVADVLEKRKLDMEGKRVGLESSKLGLQKGQREERQAPTDEDVRRERDQKFRQGEATIANTRASTARTQQLSKQEDNAGRILAGLDWLEQNEDAFKPENMAAVDRVYLALAKEDFSGMQPGDIDTAASAISPLLDKRKDFNGMPILQRRAKVLTRDGKLVLEMAYVVQGKDGKPVEANAGPLRKATEDGTDAVYELEEDEAMRLLAGAKLIGSDVQKLGAMGGNYKQAVQALRQQYIEKTGGKGVPALKSVAGVAGADNTKLGTTKINLGQAEFNIQSPYGEPVNDEALVVGGVITDEMGKTHSVRTLGDAKRVLGLPADAPVEASDGGAVSTPSPFVTNLGLPKQSGGKAASSGKGPSVGTVSGGYRFKGGNPNDKANWEPV